MAKLYKYENFDLIAFAQAYMYACFSYQPELCTQNFEMNGHTFIAGKTEVIQIGKLSKGAKSKGYSELKMLPGHSLLFAGKFEQLVLFRPKDGDQLKFKTNKKGIISGTSYKEMFVAFYDITDWLCILTSAQASRLVAQEFVFI